MEVTNDKLLIDRELLDQAKPKLWAASAGDLPRNIDEWLERNK